MDPHDDRQASDPQWCPEADAEKKLASRSDVQAVVYTIMYNLHLLYLV